MKDKDIQHYFTKQEDEISNKYMHANGVGAKSGNTTYGKWDTGIKLVLIGVLGYVVYRMTSKKK